MALRDLTDQELREDIHSMKSAIEQMQGELFRRGAAGRREQEAQEREYWEWMTQEMLRERRVRAQREVQKRIRRARTQRKSHDSEKSN